MRLKCNHRSFAKWQICFWLLLFGLISIGSFCLRRELLRSHLPCYEYSNEEKTINECGADYLVFLSENNDEELAQKELENINAAANSYTKNSKKSKICIISQQKIRGLYAKIILHSYGVDIGNIEVTGQIIKINSNKNKKIFTTGLIASHYSKLFKNLNAKAIELKSSRLKILFPSNKFTKAMIVLGNQPLGLSTPTIDLIKRTLTAVNFYKDNPDTLLVFSGAATTGGISEAKMMGLIAEARGVPQHAYLLEEESFSTHENVLYCSKLLRGQTFHEILIVSKPSHLTVAMPLFLNEFNTNRVKLTSIEVNIGNEEIIRQMDKYASIYDDPIVKGRLKVLQLQKHKVGID